MKFSDLFVPRWQNSNPEVRKRAVQRLKDIKLLGQIADMDEAQVARLGSDTPGISQETISQAVDFIQERIQQILTSCAEHN